MYDRICPDRQLSAKNNLNQSCGQTVMDDRRKKKQKKPPKQSHTDIRKETDHVTNIQAYGKKEKGGGGGGGGGGND